MDSLSTEKVSERAAKIREIMEACMVSKVVVYNWMAGRATPDALRRRVISGVLNIPEGELFPNAK